jgi:hypothetical protein
MSLERIAKRIRPPSPQDSELPMLQLVDESQIRGLIAWFGADSKRRAARIVIGDETGVLAREHLYELVAGRTLGWGDSIGATLPGDPEWEPIELRCPISDCPRSPLWVLSFNSSARPECTIHTGTELERVQQVDDRD